MAYTLAAKTNEIEEGKGKRFEINGKPIALFKKNGVIFATDEACPHAGGPLSEAELDGETITCPWHGFQYNLKTGQSPQHCTLKTYPVKIDGEKILIDV